MYAHTTTATTTSLSSGIDVPFHSREIRAGVPAFRAVLESMLPTENIPVNMLVGK